ncbi:type VI secretion protein [Streptomyces sp. H27-D2]|nr:type VI secretion protein [Streptomyces sp. H27-D2]MEC4015716.1 type VI secretion protein [Streptomyces sp. H27-D2]
MPDSLLLSVLAFLLSLTVLVWLATGLAGLFSHGGWPDGVRFTHTPLAIRHLAGHPQDLPTAWPQTPDEQLSGYGLFWGILVSELMVLFVLTIFTLGVVTRYRAVRAARREDAAAARAAGAAGAAGAGTAEAGTAGAGAASGPGAGGAPAYGHLAPGGGVEAEPPAREQPPRTPATAATDTAPAPRPAAPPTPAQTSPLPLPVPHPLPPPRPPPRPGPVPVPLPVPVPVPTRRTGELTGSQALFLPSPQDRREAAILTVQAAVGPVLVVTSDAGIWAETKGARAKLGPVHVYDPTHLCDTPARLRWSPSRGCESRETAAARAVALLAPIRPVHAMDSAVAEAAETLLRCWLHAAAVDGRPFRLVHRWATGGAAHEPVRILRTNPKAASGAAGELESTLTGHPERREIAQQLAARALSALSSIHLRDACGENRSDALALESFIDEGGTLYVVGEVIEDPRRRPDPGAMPLLTGLVSSVVEHGRRMAARSSSGRLDPPMTLVLDNIAAVAPIPALPGLLADGEASGLPTLALFRSEEQARAHWPRLALTD